MGRMQVNYRFLLAYLRQKPDPAIPGDGVP